MLGWPDPSAVGEALSVVRYVCGLKGEDQLSEQPGEYLLLVAGQRREQGTFALLHGAAMLLECGVPGGGELDMHSAAVGLIGSPGDQAGLLDRA
jgi:hypothetical protein